MSKRVALETIQEAEHMLNKYWKTLLFAAALAAAAILTVMPAALAQSASDKPPEPSTQTPVAEDYKIGPADVLTVAVADAPEFGGKFRVSDSGTIDFPGVAQPIPAENLSAAELAHGIREALLDAKQLRNPHVAVFVDEYHGRTVTILGAVNKPSVYPIATKTNVLQALSLAGGALPNAGNIVTIVRGPASAEASNTTVGSVQILRMGDLLSGKETYIPEVKNGDTISVSAAQLVYVVGAVVKPGGFTMTDPNAGVSVVQAVALAEGLKSVASRHALVIRQSTSDRARVEIPVDISLMLTGKDADAVLAPNDILYVPTSGGKQTLRAMGELAMAAATGVAIYGLGYRAAGVQP
jgi:polysaccharide export outer membrane protein